MAEIVLRTVLTCPVCGKSQEVDMPEKACQHFYECVHCHTVLKPREGECCVFCSYAQSRCPVRQRELLESQL